MKRNNKKGFTIVELVIVIAVIAILSAVLIPTFGTVIEDANKTAAQQEARNLYTAYIQDNKTDATLLDADICFQIDNYWFKVENGQLSEALSDKPAEYSTTVLDTVDGINVYGLAE